MCWEEVAYYRLEALRSITVERKEPTLYNHAGRVLLRPIPSLVISTEKMLDERALFWQFVESKLKGKQRYTRYPPTEG